MLNFAPFFDFKRS